MFKVENFSREVESIKNKGNSVTEKYNNWVRTMGGLTVDSICRRRISELEDSLEESI